MHEAKYTGLLDDRLPDSLIQEITCGDTDAMYFLRLISSIARIADDIVDGDVKTEAMSARMSQLLTYTTVYLPNCVFYDKYKAELSGLMVTVAVSWDFSNKLKRDVDNSTSKTFGRVWAESIELLGVVVAEKCGGLDHARKMIEVMHNHFRKFDKEK